MVSNQVTNEAIVGIRQVLIGWVGHACTETNHIRNTLFTLDWSRVVNKFCHREFIEDVFKIVYYTMWNLGMFVGVMSFYATLTYVLFPVVFYYLFGRTLDSAGNGFIVGSVVSVVLWLTVGRKLVKA
jgi:hypothetical protein